MTRSHRQSHCLSLACVAAFCLSTIGCVGGATTSATDPPIRVADAANPPADSSKHSSAKHAPDEYWVKLETTKGNIFLECHRAWSPNGADRFYEMVSEHFLDGCRFFRVISGFVIQAGLNGDPAVNAKWKDKNIFDDEFAPGDKSRQSNKRGYVTFAKSGQPNSRTTQFFINSRDNDNLDQMGFTPFGRVMEGMAAVDSMYDGYAEEPQHSAETIAKQGNAYLDAAFPKLDTIKKATLLPKKPGPEALNPEKPNPAKTSAG